MNLRQYIDQNIVKSLILALMMLAAAHVDTNGQPYDESESRDGVKVVTRPLQDSIMLRWAPASPMTWHYGNEHGYMVERVTIMRDGKVLDNPEQVMLTDEPLKPMPMPKWEAVVDTSKYGAVVAQALYGETFEVSGGQSNDILSMYNKSRELDSRYSFSVYAADQAYWLAKASGLGLTDPNILHNEKYLYRVYIPVASHIFKADTAFAYAGTMDYKPLPAPKDVNGRFEDHFVMISWNSKINEGTYSSYYVERSEDGERFKRITTVPHVNTFEGEQPKTPYSYRSDSLPQNNKRYYYRVRGINVFGEVGPPSDTISGMGRKKLTANPAITGATSPDNKVMHVNWEFDTLLNDEIKGFSLLRSRQDKGPYEKVQTKIASDVRSAKDAEAQTDNYYKIVALGKHGQRVESFAYYAQLIDSMPPATPEEITGNIDTTGIVSLEWQDNTEEDMLGYRIYRSNFDNDEFVQLTSSPVLTARYNDTISLDNLTETIYYKVAAVDQRFNISDYSAPLALKKPDKVPPVTPLLKNPAASEEGVVLSWVPSSSADVAQHVLYRSKGNNQWEVVTSMPVSDTTHQYLDHNTVPGRRYLYTIVAVDDDGLESDPARPLEGERTDWKIRPTIEDIESDVDRNLKKITLSWHYDHPELDRYVIYKASGETSIRIYTSVPGEKQMFIDKKIEPGTNYAYRVKAIFKDGAASSLSDRVEVEF